MFSNWIKIKQYIKIILMYIKGYIKYLFPSKNFKLSLQKGKKYAIIFCAADYNNLGDLAITIAQEKFLKDKLGENTEIIKVSESNIYYAAKDISKLNKNDILITIIGGGNNGSLYEFIEAPRRFLLRVFKNYTIISFPQSCYFEQEDYALPYKKEFIKCCKKCQNLTLVAREQNTYNAYREMGLKNIILVPDIVFYLDNSESDIINERFNKIVYILRNDKEKKLTTDMQERLIYHTSKLFKQACCLDTCDIKYNDNSEELLFNFLEKIKNVEMVLTDRLHGMILCYITNTPCIVIDNNNGKIKSTHNTWLTNQNFIKLYNPEEGINKYDEDLNGLRQLKNIKKGKIKFNYLPLEQIVMRWNNEREY